MTKGNQHRHYFRKGARKRKKKKEYRPQKEIRVLLHKCTGINGRSAGFQLILTGVKRSWGGRRSKKGKKLKDCRHNGNLNKFADLVKAADTTLVTTGPRCSAKASGEKAIKGGRGAREAYWIVLSWKVLPITEKGPKRSGGQSKVKGWGF